MKKISDQQINFLLFILLTCAVIIIHSILLAPAIHLGPHGDDWKVRVWCKVLGSDIFTRFFDILKEFNIDWTYQVYHMCFLEHLFGFNPEAFQKANIILKSVAALSIFPLTLAVFKNRWLASLAVLLFSMGFTSSATLNWVITGGDYLALTFMNFFLLTYYYLLSKKNQKPKWFLLLSILFAVTFFFSPMRLYPLATVPLLIEIFFLLYNHSVNSLKSSLFRLIAVYWVFILLIFKPDRITPLWMMAENYFNNLGHEGLAQILLLFTAIGQIAIEPVKLGQLFGPINSESIRNPTEYNWYLLKNPMPYFLILTMVVAFISSKKPLVFIILVLFLNYLADLLAVDIFIQVQNINNNLTDTSVFKFLLLGVYIVVVAIVSFWEWLKQGRKNGVLLALALGPAISLLFIEFTIMFGGKNLSFNGVHRYLVIPSMGIYIFIAALLTALIQKIILTKVLAFKLILSALVILYLIFNFQSSKTVIQNHFGSAVKGGRGSQDQAKIHRKLTELLDKSNFQTAEPSFFYLETPGDLENGLFFYEALYNNFTHWIHLEKRGLAKGCIGWIFREKDKLKEAVIVKNGIKGLQYSGACITNNNNLISNLNNIPDIFYKPENIYAFMLANKDVTDITDRVLEEIGLKNF